MRNSRRIRRTKFPTLIAALGVLAASAAALVPGISSAGARDTHNSAWISVAPYRVAVGDTASIRGQLPCAPAGSTATVTDAAGAVTGTDVTFRAGGRFHTEFTVVTPTATGASPGVTPTVTPTATGVDAIQVGTPDCGAVAPVKILSATPTESPSVTVTPSASPSVTGTPQVVPGGSVHVQHER